EIKVGYNLRRKVVLMSIWALSPILLYLDPTLFGVFTPHADTAEFVRHVAQIWLVIAVGGLIFRTIHLFFIQYVTSGLAWATQSLTGPSHAMTLDPKAALALLRGRLIDPTHGRHSWDEDEAEEAPHATT